MARVLPSRLRRCLPGGSRCLVLREDEAPSQELLVDSDDAHLRQKLGAHLAEPRAYSWLPERRVPSRACWLGNQPKATGGSFVVEERQQVLSRGSRAGRLVILVSCGAP